MSLAPSDPFSDPKLGQPSPAEVPDWGSLAEQDPPFKPQVPLSVQREMRAISGSQYYQNVILKFRGDLDAQEYVGKRIAARQRLRAVKLYEYFGNQQAGNQLSPAQEIEIDELIDAVYPVSDKLRSAEKWASIRPYVEYLEPELQYQKRSLPRTFFEETPKAAGRFVLKTLQAIGGLLQTDWEDPINGFSSNSTYYATTDAWIDWLLPRPAEMPDPNRFTAPAWMNPPGMFSAYGIANMLGSGFGLLVPVLSGPRVLSSLTRIGKAADFVKPAAYGQLLVFAEMNAQDLAQETYEQRIADGADPQEAAEASMMTKYLSMPGFVLANVLSPEFRYAKGMMSGKPIFSQWPGRAVGLMAVQEGIEGTAEGLWAETLRTITGMNRIVNREDPNKLFASGEWAPLGLGIFRDENDPWRQAVLNVAAQGLAEGLVSVPTFGPLVYAQQRAMNKAYVYQKTGKHADALGMQMLRRVASSEFGVSPEVAGSAAQIVDALVQTNAARKFETPESAYASLFAEQGDSAGSADEVLYATRERVSDFHTKVRSVLVENWGKTFGKKPVSADRLLSFLRTNAPSESLTWSGLRKHLTDNPKAEFTLSEVLDVIDQNSISIELVHALFYTKEEQDQLQAENQARREKLLSLQKVWDARMEQMEQEVAGVTDEAVREEALQRAYRDIGPEYEQYNSGLLNLTTLIRGLEDAATARMGDSYAAYTLAGENSRKLHTILVRLPDSAVRSVYRNQPDGPDTREAVRWPTAEHFGQTVAGEVPAKSNHLFWIRMDETDVEVNGAKVPALRVLEIQSDIEGLFLVADEAREAQRVVESVDYDRIKSDIQSAIDAGDMKRLNELRDFLLTLNEAYNGDELGLTRPRKSPKLNVAGSIALSDLYYVRQTAQSIKRATEKDIKLSAKYPKDAPFFGPKANTTDWRKLAATVVLREAVRKGYQHVVLVDSVQANMLQNLAYTSADLALVYKRAKAREANRDLAPRAREVDLETFKQELARYGVDEDGIQQLTKKRPTKLLQTLQGRAYNYDVLNLNSFKKVVSALDPKAAIDAKLAEPKLESLRDLKDFWIEASPKVVLDLLSSKDTSFGKPLTDITREEAERLLTPKLLAKAPYFMEREQLVALVKTEFLEGSERKLQKANTFELALAAAYLHPNKDFGEQYLLRPQEYFSNYSRLLQLSNVWSGMLKLLKLAGIQVTQTEESGTIYTTPEGRVAASGAFPETALLAHLFDKEFLDKLPLGLKVGDFLQWVQEKLGETFSWEKVSPIHPGHGTERSRLVNSYPEVFLRYLPELLEAKDLPKDARGVEQDLLNPTIRRIEITDQIRQKMLDPEYEKTILATGVNGPLASTTFLKDGRAILRAFEKSSSPTVFFHEIGHVLEKMLTPEEMSIYEQFAKVEVWDTQAREDFANFWVSALGSADFVVPPGLRTAVSRVRAAMIRMYQEGVQGLYPFPVSREMSFWMEDLLIYEKGSTILKHQHELLRLDQEVSDAEAYLKELVKERKKLSASLNKLGQLTEAPQEGEKKGKPKPQLFDSISSALPSLPGLDAMIELVRDNIKTLQSKRAMIEQERENAILSQVFENRKTLQERRYEELSKDDTFEEALKGATRDEQTAARAGIGRRIWSFIFRFSDNFTKTPAGRWFVRKASQIWDRDYRLMLGKFDYQIQLFGKPGLEAQRFLGEIPEGSLRSNLEYLLEGTLVLPRNMSDDAKRQLTNYKRLAQDISRYLGYEATKASLWRTGKDGEQIPFEETERSLFFRFSTPAAREIMVNGGDLWHRFKEAIQELNPGVDASAIELWRKDMVENAQFVESGMLERTRGIQVMPSVVKDDAGKILFHVLIQNPTNYLHMLMRFGSLRISMARVFGQSKVENVAFAWETFSGERAGEKPAGIGAKNLLEIFGIRLERDLDQVANEVLMLNPEAEILDMNGNVVKKWLLGAAKELGVSLAPDWETIRATLMTLGPSTAKAAGLSERKLKARLRELGRKMGGVDTRKSRDVWDLLNDIKQRYEKNTFDHVLDVIRLAALQQGESNMPKFEEFMGLMQGKPVLAEEQTYFGRSVVALSEFTTSLILSMSAPLNLAQLPIMAGMVGHVRLIKAAYEAIYNGPELEARLRHYGALQNMNHTFGADSSYAEIRFARAVREGSGILFGHKFVNDWLDATAGAAALDIAQEVANVLADGKSLSKRMIRLLNYLGMDEHDLKSIREQGALSEEQIAGLVTNTMKRMNAANLNPADRGLLEMDPRLRLIRTLKSYSINMTRNVVDFVSAGIKAYREKDSKGLVDWGVGALSYAIGIAGAAVVTDWITRARAGRSMYEEHEDLFGRAGKAFLSTGIAFPLDTLTQAWSFSKTPEEAMVNLAPPVSFILEAALFSIRLGNDLASKAAGKDPSLRDRLTRDLTRSIPVLRTGRVLLDRMLYPDRVEYEELRREVQAWKRKQTDYKEPGIIGLESDWKVARIKEALMKNDTEELDELRVLLYEDWIKKDEDPLVAVERIRQSLLSMRPLSLSEENILKFKKDSSPELWQRMVERNRLWMQGVYRIVPPRPARRRKIP